MDLAEELWGRPTVRLRRLLTLVYHLPGDSEFLEDIELGIKARWDVKTELLATIAELLDVNTRKGTKRRKPLVTIKRPWKKEGQKGSSTKPVPMSSPEARRFFGGNVHYEPKPELTELGGGWYELPDGTKVQGRAKALDKLKPPAEDS